MSRNVPAIFADIDAFDPDKFVTHLTEDGVDRRFIQEAAGHRCDTSTAIYTHVSGDFMNTALRKALALALDVQPG